MLSGLSLYGDLISLREWVKEIEELYEVIIYGRWVMFLNSSLKETKT